MKKAGRKITLSTKYTTVGERVLWVSDDGVFCVRKRHEGGWAFFRCLPHQWRPGTWKVTSRKPYHIPKANKHAHNKAQAIEDLTHSMAALLKATASDYGLTMTEIEWDVLPRVKQNLKKKKIRL